MDRVHFPYRSDSHLSFLHVVAESGCWEKHGLQVEYDYFISSEDAHKFLADGSVEFVGGNHVSPYARRLQGDQWVYLGQTVSILNHRLVARADSGISKLPDLKGKVIGTKGSHPTLNTWLFLKQHGLDEDKGDFKFQVIRGEADTWHAVQDGKVAAAFVTPPADLFAQRAGLRVIVIDYLPMVWFTTVSSGFPFVEKHSDLVDRFLKGLVEGIAYFKTHKEEAIRIIQTKYKVKGELDREVVTHLYNEVAKILEAKPYATVAAISNVYQLAMRQDTMKERVEPLQLWDFHYLRRIDDSGFIDRLYKG